MRSDLIDWGLSEQTVKLGPDTIHFWEGGSGPPLLLLHGFGACAMWQWYEQIEDWSQHFHLIIPNLLWFGASHSSAADYSLTHQVRAVEALLDELGVKETAVAGLSYGGLVTLQAAATHPARYDRVVIVDSPGPVFGRKDQQALLDRFQVKNLAELFIPRDEEGVGRLLTLVYADPPYTPDFARRQILAEMYGTYSFEKRELLHYLLDNLEQLVDEEQTLSQPVLVIWGREDPVFPLALGNALTRRLGDNAQLRVIDHAHHAPNMEYPQPFNTWVRDFLQAP